MKYTIGILGTGGWGTALGLLLCDKGYTVKMWSPFPEEINTLNNNRENPLLSGVKIPEDIIFTSDLNFAVSDTVLLVMAVPSSAVRSVCNTLSSFNGLPLIVNVAKGFDDNTNERLSAVIKEELNTDKVVILSGPTHAEEVARKLPTTIVAACENLSYAEFVQNIFMCDYLRVYTNTDVVGVEVCGALKNVIALCAGISDGCGLGDNAKAALMTRGMKEIQALGIKMGGRPETFIGLAGIGDLIVTCTSMHSRNRRAGILIGQGKSAADAMNEVKMVVEGIGACMIAKKLSDQYQVDMPIVNTAYNILSGDIKPLDAVKSLMLRDKKQE